MKKGQFVQVKFLAVIFLVIILLSIAEYNSGLLGKILGKFATECVTCSPMTIFFVQSLPAIIIIALIFLGIMIWRSM